MSRLLSFNGWTTSNSINENIQAAKLFLTKRYIAKQEGIRVEDVTREQAEDRENQKRALDNEHYREILNIVGTNHGYVYPFVKFVVNCRATIDELRDLYSKITTYAGSLKSLPMSIEEYSNVPTVNGKRSIVSLFEEFETIESSRRQKKHDWIIEKVGSGLRHSIKNTLSKQQINRLLLAAEAIDQIDKMIGETLNPKTGQLMTHKAAFLSKSNAFSTGESYLERAEHKANGVKQQTVEMVVDKLRTLEPEAGIIYNKDLIIVLAIRTERAQHAVCSIGEWCINRNMWSSYGGASNAIQINIFDYNRTMHDPMFLVGTTIKAGRVTNSHDLYNDGIVRSNDPREQFTRLGYPTQLINDVMSTADSELIIKQFVTGLGIDTSSPEKSLNLAIISGYGASETNPQLRQVFIDFVRTHVVGRISDEKAIEVFSKLGILSEFSARIFNTLGLREEIREKIIAKNRELLTNLRSIVDRCGFDFNQKATTAVMQADKIAELLQNGDTVPGID